MFLYFVINSQIFIFFIILILFLYGILVNINSKIIFLLVNINFSFFILKIIYYNFISIKFNGNFDYMIKKEIFINDSFSLNNYTLVNYKYLYFFGVKYNLLLILNRYNNLHIQNFDYINNITISKKYYYDLIISLIFKYSEYFKNIDFYILNNIKEFIY